MSEEVQMEEYTEGEEVERNGEEIWNEREGWEYEGIRELDVNPRRDDDASPMSSYRCMLRPTWMFMDRMIAPINVGTQHKQNIVYVTWQQKHTVNRFFFNKIKFLTSHDRELVKSFPFKYHILM